MKGDNRPLALNAWGNNENSFSAARAAIDHAIDPETDDYYARHPYLTNFIANALEQRITAQSNANSAQYSMIAADVPPGETEFIEGHRSHAELVGYLLRHDPLESIEIARRTHPRTWDTGTEVDAPVRANLDDYAGIGTEKFKSPPVYRVKNLNVVDSTNNDRYFVQIDRKRTIRHHFGGLVLTVVRNSLVIHDNDMEARLPNELRQYISDERNRAVSDGKFNYDQHYDMLEEYVEPHILNRNEGDKPGWVIPILTTYYSVKLSAIKEPRLREIQ